MSLLNRIRKKHRAVYWGPDPDQPYDRFGNINYLPPIQIKCYWMDTQERELTGLGEEITVRSTVYPDRALVSGGVVWKGLLVDAPSAPPEHHSIRILREIDPIRGKNTVWIVKI